MGNYGTIIFYNGTEWQNVSGITEKTLYGVWWASKNEAFAVGDKGLILHFNGEDLDCHEQRDNTAAAQYLGRLGKRRFRRGGDRHHSAL